MRAAVIGVGNELRGDDAVGVAVARAVAARRPELDVRLVQGDALELIEALEGRSIVIIIDALQSQHDPGFIVRFDASSEDLPADLFARSTHSFGLADAIALARSLGKLPAATIIYGIEGASYALGTGLSREVAAIVPAVVDRVLGEPAGRLIHARQHI